MVYVDALSSYPLPIYFGGVFRPNKNYFLLAKFNERKRKVIMQIKQERMYVKVEFGKRGT